MSKKHDWNQPVDENNLSWQFVVAYLAVFCLAIAGIAVDTLGWLQ